MFVGLLLVPVTSMADTLRENVPYVVAGYRGSCYAKSVPAESYGQRGKTTIYSVEASNDVAEFTYDWYSNGIYVSCMGRTLVVRMGPWAIGRRANKSDLALAFYLDGKLLKRYSTLAIAGKPSNVSASVSHYVVFSSVDGFQWPQDANQMDFIATRIDGTRMRFSSLTGELVRTKP